MSKIIDFTDTAEKTMAEILQSYELPGGKLRVEVVACGCHARYALEITDTVFPDDHEENFNGFSVVIAAEVVERLNGTVVDYIETADGSRGFVFNAPNLGGCCGSCGGCQE